MRWLGVLLLAAVLCLLVFLLFTQETRDTAITAKKIGDRIVLVRTGQTSVGPNVSAVSTSKGLIVFDTQSDPGLAAIIRKAIEREFGTREILYIVLTHGAPDHTGGSEVFSDAVIIGHENVPAEMSHFDAVKNDPNFRARIGGLMERLKTNLKQYEKGSPEAKEIEESIAYFDRTLKAERKVTRPAMTFSERLTLKADDLTLIMVHNVPSYSESDVIIFVPELRLLNVGDIFNPGRVPVINMKSDIPRWLDICQEFLDQEAEIDVVIGGHGEPLTMADVRAQFNYVEDLYEGIQKAHQEGLSREEIKKKFAFENFNRLTDYRPPVMRDIPEADIHAGNVDVICNIVGK